MIGEDDAPLFATGVQVTPREAVLISYTADDSRRTAGKYPLRPGVVAGA
jgi:hypothetical protein